MKAGDHHRLWRGEDWLVDDVRMRCHQAIPTVEDLEEPKEGKQKQQRVLRRRELDGVSSGTDSIAAASCTAVIW